MKPNESATRDRSLLAVHAWIVALVTLLAVGAAVTAALARPESATVESRVELRPEPTRGAPLEPNMGTEREVATSGVVAAAAGSRMGMAPTEAGAGLSVSVVADTRVLVLRYTAPTAQEAFDGGAAFTGSYLEVHNEGKGDHTAIVITEPKLISASSGSDLAIIVVIGLLAGLGIGVASAWVWDRVSDRVRSVGELDRSGVPVLAMDLVIPQRGAPRPSSSARTSFGFLATRLAATTESDRRHLRVLVTAPRPGSGTSAVAVNLAAALKAVVGDVTLVDANLATVGISDLVVGPPVPGFRELLLSDCSVEGAVRQLSPSGLRVVPSAVTAGPTQLDVERMSDVLGELASSGDVVVDGPPLLEAPEAYVLARSVDVVLVVADLRSLRRRDVAEVVERLASVSPSLVGWVTHTHKEAHRRTQPRSRSDRGGTPSEQRVNGVAVPASVRSGS